ncbi:hypothetical protein [Streptomyces sp. NPDC006463]|uniref:hypothetical protein n=1 Tax=Streptomyces sp. NPDC006463 TaxID=3364746 RepID=UPI0036C45984
MLDPELLERITARRAELDELEERLAKELAEVRAERPSWNRYAASWSDSSIAAGCGNSPTAGSPRACD